MPSSGKNIGHMKQGTDKNYQAKIIGRALGGGISSDHPKVRISLNQIKENQSYSVIEEETTPTPIVVVPFIVIETDPVEGAFNISAFVNGTVSFSDKVDPATVTTTEVPLESDSVKLSFIGGLVPITLNVHDEVIDFSPVGELDPETLYTLTVTTDVKRLSDGLALAEEFVLTFITEGGK